MNVLRLCDYAHGGDACHFATTQITAREAGDPHRHEFHELFWIESGEGTHWVNDRRRDLDMGQLVLIRAPDAHAFTSDEDPLCLTNVAFEIKTWDYLRRRYFNGQEDLFAAKDIEQREFTMTGSAWLRLQEYAQELRRGSRTRLTIERFLINVADLIEQTKAPPAAAPLPDWLEEACREITDPQYFSGGTPAFCELAGKSPEHVARAVRRYMNRTPTDIVNDARMAWAATRLATTGQPIIDISLACGFENLGHFYRLFHAKFAATPRQYRLEQQRIVRPGGGSIH